MARRGSTETAQATAGRSLEVGGRRLAIRHLDRVVFPQTQTTKADLLDYYVRIGGVMLPHLRERLLHMHRYPEGVEGPRFWQKGCPEHRPGWMQTAPVWSRDKHANIDFCVVDELASLLWAVNIGSIELHTVRAKARPTVSTPVRWSEVEAAVDAGDPALLTFEMHDVLERVAVHGDLFADVLALEQRLVQPSST